MESCKDAVARFIISQVIECPHCQREFDVIATNRNNPDFNQGKIKVSQSIHEKADRSTPTKEVETFVPRPFYFGSLMQYTKFSSGNEEYIECPNCWGNIRVPEVDWDYSIHTNYETNRMVRLFRKIFPRRAQPELCMNKDE